MISLGLTVMLLLWALTLGYLQRDILKTAFQERGVGIARAFSSIGAAAVQENLTRIQGVMIEYQHDADFRLLEVVDHENVIMASMQVERVGSVLEGPQWQQMRAAK